jgi:hypothetical protein
MLLRSLSRFFLKAFITRATQTNTNNLTLQHFKLNGYGLQKNIARPKKKSLLKICAPISYELQVFD